MVEIEIGHVDTATKEEEKEHCEVLIVVNSLLTLMMKSKNMYIDTFPFRISLDHDT